MTPADEAQLFTRAQRGDTAAEALLVKRHRGLVHRIVANFIRRTGSDQEFDDLLQEGFLGLLAAIRGYDPARGYCFGTYAGPAVFRHLARASGVAAPIHIPLSAQKAARAHFRVTGERTEFPSVTCSLDQPLPDSEDCLADRLISSDPSPDDVATLRAEHERLYGALARLPRCEREVIALRFGLVASPELTVRQTARALGVSNSTVSTRSRRALARLRILLTDPTECPSCAPGSPASGGEAEMVPAAREAVACGR